MVRKTIYVGSSPTSVSIYIMEGVTMIFKEEKRDLFTLDERYALAHCISTDCAMGAGIAVQFQKKYNLRGVVLGRSYGYIGECVAYVQFKDNDKDKREVVFNLMTKEKYWHKPTYESLTKTLVEMKKQCLDMDIKYLAMPKIGCGLDKLQWGKVREIIKETFQDTDIEILVCYI